MHGSNEPPLVPHVDKVAHLVVYAVLGGALAWGRRRWGGPSPRVTMALGIIYGATDEIHQAFVPLRDLSVADWIMDTVGVVLGYYALMHLMYRLTRRGGEAEPELTGKRPE